MAAKIIVLILRNNANFMLISEKTTGRFFFVFLFFCVERRVSDRQLEKITVKKAQAKLVKCAKNKSWVPRTPPPLVT